MGAPPKTRQRTCTHRMTGACCAQRIKTKAFITITTYFESPVDPLHINNSNARWYHYL